MTGNVEELVIKAQEGDRESISSLFDLYEKELFRFCLFLAKDSSLAKDLSQESFVRALEEIDNLMEPKKFKSWLFKIAKNLFFDFVKKSSSKNEVASESKISNSIGTSFTDDEELLVHVALVLEDLSHEDQVVLLLADLESHSYEEIAEIMDKSVSAVKSQLHRAREHFMSKFSDNRNDDTSSIVLLNKKASKE